MVPQRPLSDLVYSVRTTGDPPTEEACYFPELDKRKFACYKCGKLYKQDGKCLYNHVAQCIREKTARIHRTEPERREILERQEWKCNNPHGKCPLPNQLLKGAPYDLDHIQPLADGGRDVAHNLQALCKHCHGWKTALNRCGR